MTTKVSTVIFGLMIFTMIIIGGTTFYSGLTDSYNQTDNVSRINGSYINSSYFSATADNINTELNADDGGLNQISIADLGVLIFKAPYTILKSFMGSINTLMSAGESVAELGVPTWVFPFIYSGISIMIGLVIINAIWKKEV